MDPKATSFLDTLATLPLELWLKAGVLLVSGLILSRLTRNALSKLLESKLPAARARTWARVFAWLVLLLFVVSAFRELGFRLSVLLGAAGVFTVAIGFAAQTSTSNLISGLFLVAEKPFGLGDVIEVEGRRGEVIAIDWLSVTLRMPDNTAIRVPNETLIKSVVLNVTRHPIRRIDLPVGVAYKEDLNRVKAILADIADSHPLCLEQPEPKIWVMAFGASSVDLQLSVFVRKEVFMDVKSELLEQIKARFDAEGIEIPFPHVSVYAGAATQSFPVSLRKAPPSPGENAGSR
ncbi:MAG: mechanosensitive ion channel family protein [Gammaproteobacteria bacterium]|nr:MAG: mechanosensitive ion channel family protein [Gammaproteobacteria bacterium]